MSRARWQLSTKAGRLATVGGTIAIAVGVTQAAIGSRIPEWTGNKHQPVALGLLTIALGVSVLVAARTLRSSAAPGDETLTAITLWLAFVAAVCSTTVGRLWVIPGAFLIAATGVTFAACGWYRFRSVVATHWLRGLLGLLGAFELLMAVSAASAITLAAGFIAGGALIAAAIMVRPGSKSMIAVLVAATLPFAALTWWTVVTPLLTVVALAIGLAATSGNVRPARARLDQPAIR
jgi:hypothetical protein